MTIPWSPSEAQRRCRTSDQASMLLQKRPGSGDVLLGSKSCRASEWTQGG